MALNMEDTCRICASNLSGLHKHFIFDNEATWSQKISLCLPIIVNVEDLFPKFLCERCAYKLNMFDDLRNICVKTEQYFKSFIVKDDAHENHELQKNECQNQFTDPVPLDNKEFVNLIDNDQVDYDMDITVQENEPLITSKRPIRAVRLASTAASNQDSILENLLKKNASKKLGKKMANKEKQQILKQCKYCKLVLSSPEFSAHVSEEHKKEHECHVCKNRFASEDDLEDHRELVNHPILDDEDEEEVETTKQFQCNQCQKIYNRKHLLVLHMRRHTGERPFPCNLCDKKYACKSSLNSHLLKHKEEWKHVCNYCGKGFVDKHGFMYHVRSNHTGERPFECSKCEKKFIKKQDLIKHEQTQHTDMPKELFSCDKCERICKDYDSLRSHRRSHIPVEVRKVHKCSLCVASFTGKTGLLKHMHRHTGEMPFTCDQCCKRFYTKKGLELHLIIHSGVKSFICEFCGRAFTQDNTLRVHRRTHTGERPYECDVCQKRFTQSSALNSHKKLHLRDNN